VESPAGNRTLETQSSSWGKYLDRSKGECKELAWVQMSHDRFNFRPDVNMGMNLRVLQKLGYLLTSWADISFSRKHLLHCVY